MQHELDHALAVLRQRLLGVEVEVADEVDEQEGCEERERHDGGARQARVASLEAVPEEDDEKPGRENVGDREVGPDGPLDLCEADDEDRREEEAVERRLGENSLSPPAQHECVRRHPTISCRSSAVSSTRACRESECRTSSGSTTAGRPPSR